MKRIEINSYHDHKSQFGLTRCPGHESWDHPVEFSLNLEALGAGISTFA